MTQAQTEAEQSANEKLYQCALERAKVLPLACPRGKIDFERGDATCTRAAEAACRK